MYTRYLQEPSPANSYYCLSHQHIVIRYWEPPISCCHKEISDVLLKHDSRFFVFNFPFCFNNLGISCAVSLHFSYHNILLIIWKQCDLLSIKAIFFVLRDTTHTIMKKLMLWRDDNVNCVRLYIHPQKTSINHYFNGIIFYYEFWELLEMIIRISYISLHYKIWIEIK